MSRENVVAKALLVLREQIATEDDPAKLRELVLEINSLLNLIEAQVAKLEGREPPLLH